jgi:hypothetical protein
VGCPIIQTNLHWFNFTFPGNADDGQLRPSQNNIATY